MAKTTRAAKTAKAGAGTAQSVIQMAKEKGTQFVDFKFVDLPGIWQHFAIPINELTEEVFSEGLGFDGSSIRGWKAINESDMLVIPDPATAFMDPFFALPTLSLTCSIQEPITREDYNRDPRSLAARAAEYLKSTGIADTAYFGPEAEFFVFDDVRFDQNAHEGYYHLDSVEARWNMGRQEGPNLGSKTPYKGGYFPVAPADTQADLRAEMVATMIKSISAGSNCRRASNRRATSAAMKEVASPSRIRRSTIPVRSRIQASEVSTIRSRSWLVTTLSGK